MSFEAGTYELGPADGVLSVRTKRTGAAAKAGHNLVLHVTAWKATLEVGDDFEASVVVEGDATSLQVHEGTGGMQALGDDDKASIEETIDDEVLKRQPIAFRSTSAEIAPDGRTIGVEGELTLVGESRLVYFELTIDGGRLAGSVVIKQSDWGISPYSTLFGALKVVDEVEVAIDAELSAD